MSNLTSKPLTRQQINYAKERCRRIAGKKRQELEELASLQREPELTDYDRVMLIKDGRVELDVSRNKAVDRKLSAVREKVSRRESAILDRFELGEPSEALDLLTKFEAEEFTL